MVDLVAKELDLKGRKLTNAQRNRLFELSKNQELARVRQEKAHRSAQVRFTEESGKAVARADKELADAARKLDQYVAALVPESASDLLAKVLQGNLLTLRSIVQNVVGNLMLAPMRGARNVVASTLDALYGRLKGKERTLFNPVGTLREQARGAFEGVRSASEALLKGPGDRAYLKGEIQRGFRPLRSLVQAFTGEDMSVVAKTGRVRFSDRFKRLLEGVLGWAPETMFRFLRLGDDPFRLATYRGELANQAKLRGLEPGTLEYKQFMAVPPKSAEQAAEFVGRKATFSQDNAFGQWIARGEKLVEKIPVAGGSLKFLFKVVAPFRQFPINYVATALDYVAPPYSLIKAMVHGARGNQREALESIGAAVVGGAAWTAADYLWENGLLTPPVQWQDRKMKDLQFEMAASGRPPGALNVSGLARLLSGGEPAPRNGDTYLNYEGLGIPGMVFWMMSNNELKRQKRLARGKRGAGFAVETLKKFPEAASFMLDQTFVAGVNSLMQALLDWDRHGEHFMGNMFRAVSSVPVPNTVQTINTARWEYVPELRGKTPSETFTNIWNYKVFQLDADAPVKVGLFGEPVRRTPQGRNPYAYNMLDPLKVQRSRPDSRAGILWHAYRRTGDSAVIPSHLLVL